jgi:hypothetical protein
MTGAPAPRRLEPRTWEAFRADLGDRAACAFHAEDRWGAGSGVLRLHEANERQPYPIVVVPEPDFAVVGDRSASQKTPR